VDTGDQAGQAAIHHSLATLWELQDRPDRSMDHAQRAITLYQAAGRRRGHADGLNGVVWSHALLGYHTQALSWCERAVTLHQQAGDRYGEANAWETLGYAHRHLAEFAQAASCYQYAIALYRDLGDRYHEADALARLGETQHTGGHPAAAHAAWIQALGALADLDHPDAAVVRAKLAILDPTTTQATGAGRPA